MMEAAQMNKTQKVFMKSFMDDFLRLQEAYYNPKDTDTYWDGLVADAMELIARFKTKDERQNTFCQDMVLAFVKSRE
jgi:hypothetical protein